jgi:hypothetical protein
MSASAKENPTGAACQGEPRSFGPSDFYEATAERERATPRWVRTPSLAASERTGGQAGSIGSGANTANGSPEDARAKWKLVFSDSFRHGLDRSKWGLYPGSPVATPAGGGRPPTSS